MTPRPKTGRTRLKTAHTNKLKKSTNGNQKADSQGRKVRRDGGASRPGRAGVEVQERQPRRRHRQRNQGRRSLYRHRLQVRGVDRHLRIRRRRRSQARRQGNRNAPRARERQDRHGRPLQARRGRKDPLGEDPRALRRRVRRHRYDQERGQGRSPRPDRRRGGVPPRQPDRSRSRQGPRALRRADLRLQGHQDFQREAQPHRFPPRAHRGRPGREEGRAPRLAPEGRDPQGPREEHHRLRRVRLHRRRDRRAPPHHRHELGAHQAPERRSSRSARNSTSWCSTSTASASASRSA